MQSANAERLRQAFPELYSTTRFECDDRWFSLLMSLGARLERELRNERARLAGQAGGSAQTARPLSDACVEVALETSDSLEISLHEETPALMKVLKDFLPQMQETQRTAAMHGSYLNTHNHSEQTDSEEAIRADKGVYDAAPHTPRELGQHTES